jgi:hypothetical protein
MAQLTKITATYERNKARSDYIGRMPQSIEKWTRWVGALDAVLSEVKDVGDSEDSPQGAAS